MKSSDSIRRQLLRGLLIPLCTLFLFSTVVAYSLAAWFANDAYDHELVSAAHAVAARLTVDDENIVAELPPAVQAVLRHNDEDNCYYQVLSLNGKRLAGDAFLPMVSSDTTGDVDSVPGVDRPVLRYSQVNGGRVRIARIKVPLTTPDHQIVVVQVARTLNARQTLIDKIFLSIVVPQLVLVVLSVLAVWLSVRHGLSPLYQLSEDIQKRSQVDLAPISNDQAPEEIIPIINALNELLARLDAHIAAQQRFVANAAHQLRTPVAGLKAYIEYGRRAQNGKINEVLDHLDAGTDRMSELVAGLLVLARATDCQAHEQQMVDLNDVSSEVTSTLIGQAASKQIELSFQPSAKRTYVKGDKRELREMVSNLVDNAIRYTQQGGQVHVSLSVGPPAVLTVSDNGPGIPIAERERVFERFYRVLGTRVHGTGLGLAIVSEIAQTHHARVELCDPERGRGTVVRITFASAPG